MPRPLVSALLLPLLGACAAPAVSGEALRQVPKEDYQPEAPRPGPIICLLLLERVTKQTARRMSLRSKQTLKKLPQIVFSMLPIHTLYRLHS
ncbi:MAG: hypothetical protein H8E31_10050, partial [Planctomycetes bacterium]|nr:hypothetical protein [Planctomycetota bacterium]